MIFKPYPKYTSCAIQWFNEIPQSWKQVRVEQYLIKKDENIGDLWSSTQLLSLTQKGIIEKDINEGKGKTHSDYSTYQAIDIGDLVFCLFDIDETPRTVGLSTKKGMITSAYTAFKSKENINTQYVYYFFESLDDAKALKPYYKGLRKTVRPPEFLKIHVPFPPKVEQVAISQFLDTETARIDNLISKQEKLIELLEEQRKSIISHAVTKGLNPNAPMKDSGVEWLGEVPEHWNLKPIKFLAKTNQLTLAENTDENYEIQYVDIGSVSRTNGIEKIETILFKDAPSRARRIVKDGDIIVSTVRTYLKAIAYIENPPKNLIVSTGFAVLNPIRTVIFPQYAKFTFLAEQFIAEVIAKSKGISYPAITATELADIKIALPPLNEQKVILQYLLEENLKMNKLISKQNQLIEKLKEYRASIISHAVTGKIDVREFGA